MSDQLPALGPLLARAVLVRKRADPAGARLGSQRLSAEDQAVDADRLWRYQQLCGFRVGDLLPPTYLHLMAFPLTVARLVQPDFPFALLGLVHIRNTITQHRPVSLTERVSLAGWAERLRPHPAGQQVDLVSEARVAGELVWQETSTYLHRQQASQRPSDGRPAGSKIDGPAVRWRVPAEIGRRYGAISGDRNPIHLHNLSARAFGFPKAIAHGMWLAARTLAAFEGRLPAGYTVDLAFKLPVFLPSEVELAAASTTGGWELEVRSVRSGKPHLAGTIRDLAVADSAAG